MPLGGVLQRLVHESVRNDALAAGRHHAFVVAHVVAPGLAVLAVPVHWFANGSFDPLVLQALFWMMTPALVAVYLARTGALEIAYFLSAAILALLVGLVAVHTGGVTSFALFWLLAVPVEAAMSGSRRVVVAAIVLCAVIFTLLGSASGLDMLPASRVAADDEQLYNIIGLISALLYIGMLSGTIEHLQGKTDEAARDYVRRFRLLAENATDMITRHGPNGDVTFISGAANKLVSCDPGELSGRGYMELVHPDDRDVFVAAFASAADNQAPMSVEFRLADDFASRGVAPDYTWVELNCRPIPDADCESGPCEIVAISRAAAIRKSCVPPVTPPRTPTGQRACFWPT